MAKRLEQTRLASSHLFTVRIWRERVEGDRKEWRGQIEQVLGGKIGYFRDWPALIAFFEEALAALEPEGETEQKENDLDKNCYG